MKKKAIKIAAASAVAASAFVAAAPVQTDAATNVALEVSKAVTQMKKAYHTYSDVTATGKFADIADVYKEYNAAKVAYNNAKALATKSGGAQKEAYLAQLEVTYDDYIAKRVVTYIDAYNYATALDAKREALAKALTDKDWNAAEKLYHEISYELKTRTVILHRVYGESTRELLVKAFKQAAQDLRDSQAVNITVKMYADVATKKVAEKDVEGAKAAIAKIDEFLGKVDKDSEFGKYLIAEVAKVKTQYDALVNPKVEAVSALNLKQVAFSFNKAIDKATVVPGNFTFDGKALSGSDKVALAADGKTVVLTLATPVANQTTKSVTVKGVKDTAGVAIADYKADVRFADFTAPSVTGVTSAGPDKFKVTFSEPVKTLEGNPTVLAAGSFSVNNGQYFVKSATVTALNEVTVELYSTLANGEYDVTVKDVQDLAGFKIADTTLKLTQVADTTAPTVAKVVEASPTKLVLEMTEDVSFVNEATAKDNIYHTNLSNKASKVEISGKTVTITFADNLAMPKGTAYVVIEKDVFKDGWGNKNAKYEAGVSVTVDAIKPVISKAEATKDNELKVTFSEEVTSATATAAANYTLLDSTGKAVSGVTLTPKLSSDGKVVTIDLSSSLSGGVYSLVVEKVKDVAGNEIDKAQVNVSVTDTTAPTVSKGTLYANELVKITFNEAMATSGAGSVLDLGNYRVGSMYLSGTNAKVSLTDSGKAVLLDLSGVANLEVKAGDKITVGKVADASGNFINAFATEVTLEEAAKVSISKVEAIDTKTIKVTLNDTLSKFNQEDFVLYEGADAKGPGYYTSVTFANVDGKGVITYTLANALDTDATEAGASKDKISVKTIASPTSENSFGVKVGGNLSSVAADKIVAVVEKKTVNSKEVYDVHAAGATINATDDTIVDKAGDVVTFTVNFSEDLEPATISKLSFAVDGFTVSSIGLLEGDNSKVVITATANADNTNVLASNIKQVMDIADLNKIIVKSGGSWAVATTAAVTQ
ncbi:Ig-like domain-containing protein [Neobacillus sp. YIM B06451]|uniref:Ig-like domain-containing protein n=1 Tax=Neobacillus sp. YIM B06451 TaxID=3070994 RepID=UPI00292EDA72|nr:Ig-like domain-containing protein [Neobacillus sp. YIM B06451]